MTSASDRLRRMLLAVVVLLGLAAIVLPAVVWTSNRAVERTARHDIAWTAANGRMEVANLLRHVLAYAASGAPDERESAELFREVLVARVATWNAGIFRSFLEERPERLALYARFAAGVAALEEPMRRIDDAVAREAMIAGIDGLAEIADRLSGEALAQSSDQITANQELLRRLQTVQQLLIGGLLAGGLLLIGLLFMQNRLLRRANAAERAAAAEYEFIAAHDVLTGLPNRASLRSAYAAAVAAFEAGEVADGRGLAVMVIDLDGFKPINDTLGHMVGDAVLVAAAERLRTALADCPGALASRFGGDEFVAMRTGVTSAEEALACARRIHACLRLPYDVDGQPIVIDACIGVAVAVERGARAQDLLLDADLALNRSKASGKGQVLLYEPGMGADIAARRALEAELARAVAQDEFEPHYQPLTDLTTGEVIGLEALVRWRHPERGLIEPGAFIAVAESSGHIVEIGRSVLEKACRDAAALPASIPVAVNLSTVQLMREDVPALVEDILRGTGLPAERLKLEITESVMMFDEARSRRMIARLRALGVSVALDDFGTGYSSLSYLRGFGFDEMKIDRSFIMALDQDTESLAIVQTIVALGQRLGLRVVAEGIETPSQSTLVLACGCTRGQGYLFSGPVPFREVAEMVAARPRILAAVGA